MISPCSESDRSVSSMWGNVAGGRETIAPWIASSTAVNKSRSFVSSPANCMDRLDVEDDLGDPFLRIHGEAVAGHGLDHEPQLVPILVDRLPARVTFERPSDDVHVEGREEESLGVVDVQQFPKRSKEERRKVVRLEAHLDLADGL